MTSETTGTDRFRAVLVLAATIGTIAFNWLGATGRLSGITTGEISTRYPTPITPAEYAFSIWTLIYAGLLAFSVYQMLPANLVRYRNVRSPYIFSCALNCAWLYFWHGQQIAICLAIILALCITLLVLNIKFRNAESVLESLLTRAPFGLYFGWITTIALINFAALLEYLNVEMSASAASGLAVALLLLVALLGVLVRIKLQNYLYPLAIAWALTAIAVKQSGKTLIVVACAAGVVACLIAAISFVMNLNSSNRSEPPA